MKLLSRRTVLVYSRTLPDAVISPVGTAVPIEFRVNAAEATKRLARRQRRFGLTQAERRDIAAQLEAGEVCVSGWVHEDLAFYGWIQFRHRRLAGGSLLPLGANRAFIYRCFTVAGYRGRGIYSAALVFMQQWLQSRGYERVFVDAFATNQTSRSGIERAGFMTISSYTVLRVLWKRWARYPPALLNELWDA